MITTREEKEFRGFGFFPTKESAPSAEMIKMLEKGKKIFAEGISSLPENKLQDGERFRFGQTKEDFIKQFGSSYGYKALGSGQLTLLEAYELFKIARILTSESGLALLKAAPMSKETITKMKESEYYIDSLFAMLIMHGQDMLKSKLMTYDIALSFLPSNQGGCGVLHAILSKNGMCAVNEGLITLGESTKQNVFSLEKLLKIADFAEQTDAPSHITNCLTILLKPIARDAIHRNLYTVDQIMDFLITKRKTLDYKSISLSVLFSSFGIKAMETYKKEIQALPSDNKLRGIYLLIKEPMLENIREAFKPLIKEGLVKAERIEMFVENKQFDDLDLLLAPSSLIVLRQNEKARADINSDDLDEIFAGVDFLKEADRTHENAERVSLKMG